MPFPTSHWRHLKETPPLIVEDSSCSEDSIATPERQQAHRFGIGHRIVAVTLAALALVGFVQVAKPYSKVLGVLSLNRIESKDQTGDYYCTFEDWGPGSVCMAVAEPDSQIGEGEGDDDDPNRRRLEDEPVDFDAAAVDKKQTYPPGSLEDCKQKCQNQYGTCKGIAYDASSGACKLCEGNVEANYAGSTTSHYFQFACMNKEQKAIKEFASSKEPFLKAQVQDLSMAEDNLKKAAAEMRHQKEQAERSEAMLQQLQAAAGLYPKVQVWQSSSSTGDRLTQKADVSFGPDVPFDGPIVTIRDVEGQTLEGFGAAFTEASALVYKGMTSEQKQQFLEDYFGPSGLGYILGRTHINSCDFSTGNYNFDDHDGDVDLLYFDDTLGRDQEALIPLIKAAQDVLFQQGKVLKLLATPWSPPAWMKNNVMMDHSDRKCLKDGIEGTWAKYFSKWISAYEAHGIEIWAITVQNEPENNATWEGCTFTAKEEADFLGQYLGPELKTTHPDVRIYVFDHNKDHVYHWAKTILSDPVARPYVHGVAFHWYTGDSFDQVRQIQDDFPEVPLLASEATWEAWRWKKGTTLATGDWSFGEGYAHDIIGDLNAGTTGWIDWNLVLDEVGGPNHVNNVCDSAIQMDTKLGEVYKHPQYYYIGHFSKFIPPGSIHLLTEVKGTVRYKGPDRPYGVCTSDDGVQATSFKRPDGKKVVVVLSCDDTTSSYKLVVDQQALVLSLPPHSIQTYIF